MSILIWVNTLMKTQILKHEDLEYNDTVGKTTVLTPDYIVKTMQSQRIVTGLRQRSVLADGLYTKIQSAPGKMRFRIKVCDQSHIVILAKGSGLIEMDGLVKKYIAPAHVVIPANKPARGQTLEESVWYCVHATDITDLSILESKY